MDSVLSNTINTIEKLLSEYGTTSVSADALAWGIMTLEVAGAGNGLLKSLRSRLVEFQMNDGRITLAKGAFEVYWPTPVALLALYHSPDFEEEKRKATAFLLRSSGRHWKKKPGDPLGHDTSIPGWSWIANTHSWIIPTSMAIMALKAYGQGEHARVRSGIQMVMDRQLSSGGWNYGNTKVFRSELRPIPECTGFALSAVHGAVEEQPVRKSIEYLHERIRTIRTPLTLSWALSGLGAWSRYPQQSKEWVVESLERQKIYGYYPVSLLCQLVLSYHAEKGLLSLFEKKGNNG